MMSPVLWNEILSVWRFNDVAIWHTLYFYNHIYVICLYILYICTTHDQVLLKVEINQKSIFRKKTTNVHPPTPQKSHQSFHSCTQHVILSRSTFVPSIIKIFHWEFVLQSRDKKSNSNTRRGDNSKSKKSRSCHSWMWHVIWSCSSLLPCIIKIFQRVFYLHSGN